CRREAHRVHRGRGHGDAWPVDGGVAAGRGRVPEDQSTAGEMGGAGHFLRPLASDQEGDTALATSASLTPPSWHRPDPRCHHKPELGEGGLVPTRGSRQSPRGKLTSRRATTWVCLVLL